MIVISYLTHYIKIVIDFNFNFIQIYSEKYYCSFVYWYRHW